MPADPRATAASRSPFVVDTHELGRRPGAMREVSRDFELTEKLGTEIMSIPAGAQVELQVKLESVLDGVLATGVFSGRAHSECSRCLEPVSEDVDADFMQLALYPDKAEDVDLDAEDLSVLVEELFDLQPPITDAVVLGLPLSPLCDDDCPGLCVDCGVPLVDNPDHFHDTIDPRMASLQQLLAAGETEGEHRGSPEA